MEIVIKNLSRDYTHRAPRNSCPCGAEKQPGCFTRYTHRVPRNPCPCGVGRQPGCFTRYTCRAPRNSCSCGEEKQRSCFTGVEKKKALEHVSVTIPSGMYGLLGPNGAGKTSLMKILATLLEPSEGEVIMNGVPIRETGKIREMIGYLPQEFSFYGNMSVYGTLDYLGMLSGVPAEVRRKRIPVLLEQVNLEENARTKVRVLSGGMKRRLGIAQALLYDPRILIVDEPTEGLDPEERVRFRSLLCEFAEGRIVILSTHILSDVEACCERTGVLNHGRLIWDGSTEELRTPTLEDGYLRLLSQTEGGAEA